MIAAGTLIRHYRIRSKLGAGGMGEVYLAEDSRLGRPVALKILPPDLARDPQRVERFLFEARAASRLSHPNIAHIYEAGDDGMLFLAMEYVEGETIAARLKAGTPTAAQTIDIAIQAADALEEAHDKGVVHRDIKPANIMLTPKGRVKLLDFGLAKSIHTPAPSESTVTVFNSTPGVVMGTLHYMSPEQALGHAVDGRSDLFSLGATLYEALTGKTPFAGATMTEAVDRIVHAQPEAIARFNYDVPAELDRIVRKCLEKDRERRYQSARDLLVDLRNLQRDSSGSQPTAAIQPAPAPRRRVPMMIAAGVAIAALGAGLAWWTLRDAKPAVPQYTLRRLTTDGSLSLWPALSPDGKLLAYASDRAGKGNLDIWVRQVDGGEPVRITQNEGDDLEPSFSPDGTKIVFRSMREPRGIYVVPALGGQERRIAPLGHEPRISPDGRQIVYWDGEPNRPPGRIQIVDSGGGDPRSLGDARGLFARWSPDGKNVLYFTERQWLVRPADGSKAPVATNISELLPLTRSDATGPAGRRNVMSVAIWDWRGKWLYFSSRTGDSTNLFRAEIDPTTWQLRLPAQQLTFGAAREVQASVAGDQIAFVSQDENTDLWSFSADGDNGKVKDGEPQRLTSDARDEYFPSISHDGKNLVYVSGGTEIRWRDLATGAEETVQAPEGPKRYAVISGDGSKVAFDSGRELWVADRGKPGRKVIGSRDILAHQRLSATGRFLAGGMGMRKRGIGIRDLDTNETTVAASGAERFWHPGFSADDRWMVYLEAGAIKTAPLRGLKIDSSAAIEVARGDVPRWSPNANWVYYLTTNDGFVCIWARPLDPATKKPSGPAVAVRHFHDPRRSLTNLGDTGPIGLAIARDKIVVAQTELSGTVWLAVPRNQP